MDIYCVLQSDCCNAKLQLRHKALDLPDNRGVCGHSHWMFVFLNFMASHNGLHFWFHLELASFQTYLFLSSAFPEREREANLIAQKFRLKTKNYDEMSKFLGYDSFG